MAIRTPSKKSAACLPLLASAFARLRPRRCANCATHRVPTASARFLKAHCNAVFSYPDSACVSFKFAVREIENEKSFCWQFEFSNDLGRFDGALPALWEIGRAHVC